MGWLMKMNRDAETVHNARLYECLFLTILYLSLIWKQEKPVVCDIVGVMFLCLYHKIITA